MISLSQVCDDDCTIELDKKKMYAVKTNKINITVDETDVFMKGTRNHKDGLYDIPIQKTIITYDNFTMPKLQGYTTKRNKINLIHQLANPKQSSIIPKLQQTVKNMKMTTFNNIIPPHIKNR